jgi:hypothetical protein
MNKRIQELAEQADRWAQEMTWSADPRYGDRPRSDLFEEKFAELIVKEVFAKIEDERFEIYQPVKESVMKHFGVKNG